MSIETAYGYLQHSAGPEGPFATEQVDIVEAPWPHIGQWLAAYQGKWRKVYMLPKRSYIVYQGKQIPIKIEWGTP